MAALQIFCPVYSLMSLIWSATASSSNDDPKIMDMRGKVDALVGRSIGIFWLFTNILVKLSLWTHASETESMLNCMLDVQERIKEFGQSSRSAYKVWKKLTSTLEMRQRCNPVL